MAMTNEEDQEMFEDLWIRFGFVETNVSYTPR